MKRLVLAATLSAALAVGVTVAQADHPTHPTKAGSTGTTHGKRCSTVKRAYIVSGDHATFAGTKNADGTYTGDLTLSPNHANHAAKKSGVDTKNHTPITLHLDSARVKLHGLTDLSALQPTDKVHVIAKIPYTKKGGHGKNACSAPGYDSSQIKVRQVVVHRPSTS